MLHFKSWNLDQNYNAVTHFQCLQMVEDLGYLNFENVLFLHWSSIRCNTGLKYTFAILDLGLNIVLLSMTHSFITDLWKRHSDQHKLSLNLRNCKMHPRLFKNYFRGKFIRNLQIIKQEMRKCWNVPPSSHISKDVIATSLVFW